MTVLMTALFWSPRQLGVRVKTSARKESVYDKTVGMRICSKTTSVNLIQFLDEY